MYYLLASAFSEGFLKAWIDFFGNFNSPSAGYIVGVISILFFIVLLLLGVIFSMAGIVFVYKTRRKGNVKSTRAN